MKTIRVGFAFLCFVSVSRLQAGTYSGGSGTEANPYQIATKADLLELGTTTSDYGSAFIMTADIDLSGESFTTAVIAPDTSNTSSGFQGTQFSGTFNGNGHVISNLTIDTEGAYNDYLGLFGYPSGSSCEIRDISLENANISGDPTYTQFAGILCGYTYQVTFSNCYATGAVSGNDCMGGALWIQLLWQL